jgi:RNA polymerase sigma factor (sigma-70 family)
LLEPFAREITPHPVMTSDQIRAAQRGDLIALNALLDELVPWVGRLCGSIALDAGADAAQETLIQVMRDLKSLREPEALRGWVRRIATREAIRHAQRARREPLFDPQEENIPDREPTSRLDPLLARDVMRVLGELSEDQRAILVLRDLEGLSEAEAAELLDVAKGTIKSRLHRAREAFRSRWLL